MLTGLKVLDMSRVLAGPVCGMMLGDLGADVIKVERPDAGDETRGWGPPFDDRGESAYYLSVNRNKLSLTADLRLPADRALLVRLAEHADVLVENFRPGTLDRHGLSWEVLKGANPRLVWCSITGFRGGSLRPGYDFVVQAESGWMSITGEPGGEPMKHGLALADVLAGKDAAVSVLAALVARATSGVGRRVEVSLQASAEAALVNVAQNVLVSGTPAGRWGNAHANLVPYQLFRASDRPLVIAVGSDAQWTACARTLALAMADDETLRTNAGRVVARDRVVAAIATRVAERTADEWIARLDAAGVPCGVVRSVSDVLDAVDASARSGLPPSVPGAVRRNPPVLGEHTVRIRTAGWAAFG